jgi:hypothetical protein
MFNDEDRLMVDVMDAPPERLYRPDVSITEWRKLVEEMARGNPITELYRPTIAGLRAYQFELTGSASEDASIDDTNVEDTPEPVASAE